MFYSTEALSCYQEWDPSNAGSKERTEPLNVEYNGEGLHLFRVVFLEGRCLGQAHINEMF